LDDITDMQQKLHPKRPKKKKKQKDETMGGTNLGAELHDCWGSLATPKFYTIHVKPQISVHALHWQY
jgi:hypothetical protein